MENKEQEIADRLEAATTLLEKTLNWLEEQHGALSGEVEQDLGDGGAKPARIRTDRETGGSAAGVG